MTDGMEKKEMAAESQIEAHTEVTSSSPDAAPPPKLPPNETLSTATDSEQPFSEKVSRFCYLRIVEFNK
ncbi:unnamed protein product [Dibothriocephalus latus]|uniref:Uncharacterized protein n=1 Tax=Dibothriocephalus latus TaxID=60516 RepID=A0A3P7RS01_DIBLA|nr:unnamed protein product [Dibothriocephalus latus]